MNDVGMEEEREGSRRDGGLLEWGTSDGVSRQISGRMEEGKERWREGREGERE